MTRKRGLGKGLDALIPTGTDQPALGPGVLQVPVERIKPNPRQPRKHFDPDSLQELADSIRKNGVLQPLVVRPSSSRNEYVLIAGQRRLQASRLAGLDKVPVITRQADEREHLELALIENLQRTDLNPLEAADGFRQLAEDFNLSHTEIAAQVGKSRTTVSNTLRLLKLSLAVRQALAAGEIQEGHARALLGLPTAASQSAALKTVSDRGLNVRQTEELVRRLRGSRKAKSAKVQKSPEETALEEEMREALGTRVSLRRSRKGGSIVIRFFSDEELNAIVDRILGKTG